MISLTNNDFQWGRSEVVVIYPDIPYINTRMTLPWRMDTFSENPHVREHLDVNIGNIDHIYHTIW